MAKEVRIAILGDSRDFSRAVSNANRDAEKLSGTLSRTAGGFGSFAKKAALGVGGIALVSYAVGKSLVDAAIESEKVTKQTDAVIKSMGGSSKVSAKQVANLSKKLSEKAGIDDELIQSGENVLLTFGKVRNEVGKGNKIFDRGTSAALNMSVALGTDLKSANIQIGKALNDPVKGITALTRAGVSFTQQQKDQIKWMSASGDTLGAQKIILGELENQFGGSAEAQATAGDRLKVVWGNLQEDLGTRLLPVVEAVADWLSDKLPGAIDFVTDKFSEFWQALTTGKSEDEGTPIETVAIAIHDALDALKKWWDDNGDKIKDVAGDVLGTIADAAKTLGTAIKDDLLPHLKDFGEWVITDGPGVNIILAGLATALGAYAAASIAAAAASLAPIAPFLLLAIAVGALSWATNELWERWKLGPKVSGVFQWIIDHALIPLLHFAHLVLDSINDIIDAIESIPSLPGIGGGGGLLPGVDVPFIPWADDGGVMPGPRGVHNLAWVAGGETILPTHKSGGAATSAGDTNIYLYGTIDRATLGELAHRQRLNALEMAAS